MVDVRINSADENKPEVIRLVKSAIGGDTEAFGKLYNIYVVPIYRYVFYHVRDKMTAEDITEEVFLKAWKALHTCWGREETFSSWLYRIAHNEMIDILRRQHKQVSLEVGKVAEMPAPKANVEVKAEQHELVKAIASLPPNQKQVIILKFIEGMNNQEIGQIMGKNQGAIRVLQMRALANLRGSAHRGR